MTTTDPFAGLERLPSLTALRTELRWLEDGDVPALLAVFGDSEVMRYWDFAPLVDEAAAKNLLCEIRRLFRDRRLYQWGIARRADNFVIGTCTLSQVERSHRRAEIGFALRKDHWGGGWMSEAVGTLVGFAFETLGLHRLEADADPRNDRSLRLLERMGFRREGYLRERFHVAGELQDSVMLGLLRREWRGSAPPGR